MLRFFTLTKACVVIFLTSISLAFSVDGNVEKKTTEEGLPGINYCPAYPGKIVYTNPDGSKLTIFLKGDESLSWAKTTDGYTLLQDDGGTYYYATKDASGSLVRTDIRASEPSRRTSAEKTFLASCAKDLAFSQRQIAVSVAEKASLAKSTKPSRAFPTNGTRKVLMILMDFTDCPFTKTPAQFTSMMNEPGYGGIGSFRDYYEAASGGALQLETTVVGVYHASGSLAKYGANIGSSKYINARLFVQEAVDAAAKDGVDFSQYDNDGDGVCDGIIVVHAGYGEEAGGPSNTLWAHKSTLGSLARVYNGVKVDGYNIDPELTGNSGNDMVNIGVICHEFGHALGLPDLYDVDYSGAHDAGKWDLMADGSWNNGGKTPSNMTAWCRAKLGWITPTLMDAPAVGRSLALANTSDTYLRVNTTTENEYFLLENRQNVGWDKYIPGHGLFIWHVDGNWNASHYAVNDDPAHQGVDLVEADNIANTNTYSGDPFPGLGNVTLFTDASTPNAKSWAGKGSMRPITNIAETNEGLISFDFMQNMPPVDAAIVAITAPTSSCAGSVKPVVTIKNNGTTDITTGTISYTLDASPAVSATFTMTIAPGATANYTFDTPADLSVVGKHTISVSIAVASDGNAENDAVTNDIFIYPSSVSSIPFVQDFEGAFPATDWTVINPDGAYTWVKAAIAGNGASTSAAKVECWNYDAKGQRDGLVTPSINLTAVASAELTFKLAYNKTNADGLGVFVSTDCGAHFTQVYYKEGEDLQTTENQGDPVAGMIPTTSDEWRQERVDLTPFVGHNILVMFESVNNYGNNLYIDDVSVAVPSCIVPTTQASNLTVSGVANTSATLGWTRGNGEGVLVLYKKASVNANLNLVDGTDYGVGADLGGGIFVAYVGAGTSTTLSGLVAATEYEVAVIEYSSTKCYKRPGLFGAFTTLGGASVATKSVTNVGISSATVSGEVISDGGSAVTERGFVWNTTYGDATLADEHIAVGSGVGAYSTTFSDLLPITTYYIRAYATNANGTVYGEESYFTTMGGCDNLSYAASLSQAVSSTYADLGTAGSEITVANTDDANSNPVNIGFNFHFNCMTFDKFILNTNGFIKLGDEAPSSAALYYTPYDGEGNGVFDSKNRKDVNIISAFNHDLTAGTGTPEYRVNTVGVAPNRVTTIQFKNLKDKGVPNGPSQFDNMEFQIQLYETSNEIRIVYGALTASANTPVAKTAAVGIKGFSWGTDNTLVVSKSSTKAWNLAAFVNGNYTESIYTFSFARTVKPTSGLTYKFVAKQPNDIQVSEVYTIGALPLHSAAANYLSASVVNMGLNPQTNVSVTAKVTGANEFNPPAVVIPLINPGQSVRVDFGTFVPTVLGDNTITVSVPADDVAGNNERVLTQMITNQLFSYADPTTAAKSAYKSPNILSCRYHIVGSEYVTEAMVQVLNNSVLVGAVTTAYIFDKNGAVIGQSAPYTVVAGDLGTYVKLPIVTPPLVTNEDFYVGFSSGAYYVASYQSEVPARSGAYYGIPSGGGVPQEFGNDARFLMCAVTKAKVAATVTLDNLTQTFDGTPKAVISTTTPAGLAVNVTYDGSAAAPVNAGNYAVVATISDPSYIGSTSGTLTIGKATAVVTISNLSQPFTGSAKPVTVETTPAGLLVDVTYNGVATVPSAKGSYAVVATVNDANYMGSQSATLEITASTGIDNGDNAVVKIFSDGGAVYVNIPELAGNAKLSVCNIIGTVVYQTSELSQGLNRFSCNLMSGMYIVKLEANGQTYSTKVVIK